MPSQWAPETLSLCFLSSGPDHAKRKPETPSRAGGRTSTTIRLSKPNNNPKTTNHGQTWEPITRSILTKAM